MNNLIGLDFETYGAVDLRTHGLHRYVNHKTFCPLLSSVTNGTDEITLDFTNEHGEMTSLLKNMLEDKIIVAHNAGFEQAVLGAMGINIPSSRFIDSAVLARAWGAGGSLEAAAPQILGTDKLEVGKELIQLFSIPGKYQGEDQMFNPAIIFDHPLEWQQYGKYNLVDAQLGLKIARAVLPLISERELEYAALTLDMNNKGWHVDLDLVQEMQARYLSNVNDAVFKFRKEYDAWDLNLSSHKQLMEWCKSRGVRAKSFDEQHVASMLKQLQKKIFNPSVPTEKKENYVEIIDLLQTKQAMGGSSLKKLSTIIDTTGTDGRLHDQYLHIGAGATYRTTGRGVQMQNLKRLNGEGDDMSELNNLSIHWDNDKLASNLRQVFTASHPDGKLIVGDFSSIESRGLAWQAGEEWKLIAYRTGDDLYKLQACRIFGIDYHDVTKEQRQIGKVGELACGYGAGSAAVKDFAAKMGVDLSETEAFNLVWDWRAANPEIVNYWNYLNTALFNAIELYRPQTVEMPQGFVTIVPERAPASLINQLNENELVSLRFSMYIGNSSQPFLSRVIHGAQIKGRNIQYWKPSERKTGDLWTDRFVDPKTKHVRMYTIYGGKLAGLLTQSLCREMFFESLLQFSQFLGVIPNAMLIGQFHDEIVVDWEPRGNGVSLDATMAFLQRAMTTTSLPDFPLAAEIKADYRYTK